MKSLGPSSMRAIIGESTACLPAWRIPWLVFLLRLCSIMATEKKRWLLLNICKNIYCLKIMRQRCGVCNFVFSQIIRNTTCCHRRSSNNWVVITLPTISQLHMVYTWIYPPWILTASYSADVMNCLHPWFEDDLQEEDSLSASWLFFLVLWAGNICVTEKRSHFRYFAAICRKSLLYFMMKTVFTLPGKWDRLEISARLQEIPTIFQFDDL